MLNGINIEIEAAEEKIKGVRSKLKVIHRILNKKSQLSYDECDMIDKKVQDIYEELGGLFINA